MTKILLLITFLNLGLNLTSHNTVSVDDRLALLTNNNNKSWYLYSTVPKVDNPYCKISAVVLQDNTYTFFANGTFTFDNGTVTRDPAWATDDCCDDLLSVEGTWEFTNNQNGIRITVLHEKGQTGNDLKMVLYNGTIDQLDANVLRFSQVHSENKIKYSFEFRKR